MKRVIKASNSRSYSGWWSKYYDIVPSSKIAELFDTSVEDVKEWEEPPYFVDSGWEHVAWLYAKPKYWKLVGRGSGDEDRSIQQLVTDGTQVFVVDESRGAAFRTEDWITPRINPREFDSLQLEEIYKGLRSGVDVSQYANTEFSRKKMEAIRKQLEADKLH